MDGGYDLYLPVLFMIPFTKISATPPPCAKASGGRREKTLKFAGDRADLLEIPCLASISFFLFFMMPHPLCARRDFM
jgi:hypothetical protein